MLPTGNSQSLNQSSDGENESEDERKIGELFSVRGEHQSHQGGFTTTGVSQASGPGLQVCTFSKIRRSCLLAASFKGKIKIKAIVLGDLFGSTEQGKEKDNVIGATGLGHGDGITKKRNGDCRDTQGKTCRRQETLQGWVPSPERWQLKS